MTDPKRDHGVCPSQYEALEARPASPSRDGHRFETPQLHHPPPRPHPLSGAGDFGGLFGELSQGDVEFRSDRGVIWALRAGTGPLSLATIFQFPRPSAEASAETEFEMPETGSKRRSAAAKRAGRRTEAN